MVLQRQPSGLLLRGPGGLLTNDPDCCCDGVVDCPGAYCGDPKTLTVTIPAPGQTGFSYVGGQPPPTGCYCDLINGVYQAPWVFNGDPNNCQWSILAVFFIRPTVGCIEDDFPSRPECDVDCLAVRLFGNISWGGGVYNWSASCDVSVGLWNDQTVDCVLSCPSGTAEWSVAGAPIAIVPTVPADCTNLEYSEDKFEYSEGAVTYLNSCGNWLNQPNDDQPTARFEIAF